MVDRWARSLPRSLVRILCVRQAVAARGRSVGLKYVQGQTARTCRMFGKQLSRIWVQPETMLDMCFGLRSHVSDGTAAHIWGVSARHIRRLRIFVTDRFFHEQLMALGWLVKMAEAEAPWFVVSRLAWDETGERLCLFGDRATHQIMVARLRIIIVWPPSAGCTKARVVDWVVVFPPLTVRTVAAAEMYAALFANSFAKPIMFARFSLMQLASVASIDLSETDHASANCKLEATPHL